MLNRKPTIILLTVGLLKQILLYNMSDIPEPCTRIKRQIRIRLVYLCNKI